MKDTLTSKKYPGLVVRFEYLLYKEDALSFATLDVVEVDILSIQAQNIEVYEYLDSSVIEGLRDECENKVLELV